MARRVGLEYQGSISASYVEYLSTRVLLAKRKEKKMLPVMDVIKP